jgi:uncharacterized protein
MTIDDLYSQALALGRQPSPDLAQVYVLLQASNDAGDARARYAIATWHLFGNSLIEKNEAYGVKLLKSLQTSNVAEAIFDLAVSYDLGRSVRRDARKAFSLYMQAALLGDREACLQIAQYYREGKHVLPSMSLYKAWLQRADQPEETISPPYRVWIDRSLASAIAKPVGLARVQAVQAALNYERK